MITDKSTAEALLRAISDRLARAGATVHIVVLGGAAMNLHGFVQRPTRDVDVLARADGAAGALRHPEPLPETLREAIAEVAVDFNQPPNWMNTVVAHQWVTGLPPAWNSAWSGATTARSRSASSLART